jgi:hypothetical protein
MILKVSLAKRGEITKKHIYVLWWRDRTVNWPALLNIKLPKKFYTKKTAKGRKRNIGYYKLVHSGGKAVELEAIAHKNFLLKTNNLEELISFLSEKQFPEEIVNFFIQKI